MRKFFGSILILIASFGLVTQTASAAPLAVSGSSYAVYLDRSGSISSFNGVAIFDGTAEQGVWESVILTVNESETDLGNGRSLISIQIRGDRDIFPVAGESGFYGIGIFGDALDLSTAVSLYDARVSFLNANNKLLIGTDNLIDGVYENNPWDGLFPAADDIFGTEELGGRGIFGINFDFFVTQDSNAVPEPAGVLLVGLGLMAMLTTRRRRSH